MPLSYVNASTVSTSGGATAVTNLVPSGTTAGDLMLWAVAGTSNTAATTPTGWAVWEESVLSGALNLTVYSRVATGSEPASYTATVPVGRWSGTVTTWRGQHSTPKDTANVTVVAAGNAAPAAITTVTPDAWVVTFHAGLTANGVVNVNWTSSNGTVRTQVTSISDTATNASHGVASAARAVPGAYTLNLASATAFSRGAVVTSAIRPAASGVSTVSTSRVASWSVNVTTTTVSTTRATSWAVAAAASGDTYTDAYTDDYSTTGTVPVTPPTVVLGGTTYTTSGTAVTSAAPALSGFVDGDWVVLGVTATGGAVLSPPTGYTTVVASTNSGASSAMAHAVYARRFVTGDTLAPAVTASAAVRMIIVPLRVQDAEPSSLFESAAVDPGSGNNTNVVTAPSLTAVASRLLITFHGVRNNFTGGQTVLPFSTPTGMTRLAQHETATTINNGLMVASVVLGAGGSTGQRSSTSAGAAANTAPIGSSFLVQPVLAPPVRVTTTRSTGWVTFTLGPSQTFSGSVGVTGFPSRVAGKRPAGVIGGAGLGRRELVGKILGGFSAAASTRTQRLGRTLTGSVATTGFMQRGFPRKMVGSLSASAAIIRRPDKRPSGSVAASSVPVRRSNVTKFVASAVTAAGNAARGTVYRTFGGSLAPSATYTKLIGRIRTVSGSLTPGGAARKRVTSRSAGSVSAGSVLRRRPFRTMRGTIATLSAFRTGIFQRLFGRAGTATLKVATLGEAELQTYLREKATLTVYTTADAMLPNRYIWNSTGAPARAAQTPDPPQAVFAVAGNQQATVYFEPPISDGGAPIINYTVAASNGQIAIGDESPIRVTGLVNGNPVTFIVRASNIIGDSVASAVTAPVTPQAGPPDAPTNVVLIRGNGAVTVTFSPPLNNGGSAITGYVVNMSTGQTVNGAGSPITVSGLTNGVPVTATVSTVTAAGRSAPSTRSAPVTPSTTPTAPLIGVASASSASATVRWSPPADLGGSPVAFYTVTTYTGATNNVVRTQTADGQSTSAAVTALSNGVAYSFTVTAITQAGSGPASARSNLVTPVAPTITTLTPTTTVNTATTRTVTLRKPTGTQAGHVLVATISTNVDAVTQTPGGWSLIGSATVNGLKLYAYLRVVSAADDQAAAWTWTLADNAFNSGGIQGYVGVDNTTPLDVAARVQTADNAQGQVSATIDPASANGMLVAAVGTNHSTATATHPPGWVEDYDLGGGSKHNSQGHYAYTTTGSQSYTWRSSQDRPMAVVLVALRRA